MFPKLISLGGFSLPTYGVLVALGFLAALWLTGRLARRDGYDPEKLTNLGVYGALAGLLGAKLLMFVFEFDYYLHSPSEIFSLATLQAGGVFFGGLAAALIFGAWYIRKLSLPVLPVLDIYGPGLALGQAVGRLGCFAAGCCWGTQCDRPWAVTFTDPAAAAITSVPLNVPLHPTQLYESALCLSVFAIVYRTAIRPHAPGRVIGLYLILIAAARFLVEFFRHHEQANLFGGPLSNAQWIAVLLGAAGVVLSTRRTLARSAAGA